MIYTSIGKGKFECIDVNTFCTVDIIKQKCSCGKPNCRHLRFFQKKVLEDGSE